MADAAVSSFIAEAPMHSVISTVLTELDETNSHINGNLSQKNKNGAAASEEVQFINEPFLEALNEVISYRKRLRGNWEEVSKDNLISGNANRCVVMQAFS